MMTVNYLQPKKSLENAVLTMFSLFCATFVIICFITLPFATWLLLCISQQNHSLKFSQQEREKRSVLLLRDMPYNFIYRQKRAGFMLVGYFSGGPGVSRYFSEKLYGRLI